MSKISEATTILNEALSFSVSLNNLKKISTHMDIIGHVLVTGRLPDFFDKNTDKTGKEIFIRLVRKIKQNNDRLPKAIFMNKKLNVSDARACKINRVPTDEYLTAQNILNEIRFPLSDVLEKMSYTPGRDWRADVGLRHIIIDVYLSDGALEDLVLAAMEGYIVPKGRGLSYTEVYGLCFGNQRTIHSSHKSIGTQSVEHIHIERCVAQIRGKASSSSYEPNLKSLTVQSDMRNALFPHESIIGDFHSHPYKTKIFSKFGVKESDQDKKHILWWHNYLKETLGDNPRVSIIVSIGRLKNEKVGVIKGRRPGKDNIIDVSFNRYHIGIAAYRINADGSTSGEAIKLYCPKILGWEAI